MKAEEIKKIVQEFLPKIQFYRREIHSNPEISYNEYHTSDFIYNELKKAGIYCEKVASTAVIGYIGSRNKYIALRADIDALPIEEQTNLKFKSKNPGIMHACGHDFHSAMLLATAQILKQYEHKLKVGIMLIFQHAEETLPGGAKELIESGIFKHKPIAIFGQHLEPELETGKIAFSEGAIFASGDEIEWDFNGKSAHAAQPHLGKDPILVCTTLTNLLYSSINSIKNPLSPVVFSITSINTSNTAINIIPDNLKMKAILRTFDPTLRTNLLSHIFTSTKILSNQFGIEVNIIHREGYPSLIVDTNTTKYAKNIATDLFGSNNVTSFEKKLWTEDFARYAEIIPASFWLLGAKKPRTKTIYGLHNPKFNPDENALFYGTALLCSIVLNFH